MIEIRNLETGKTMAALTLPSDPGKASNTVKIIFHRYGDQYFLSELRTAKGVRGRFAPSPAEKELRASGGGSQMASVSISAAGN